MNLMLRSTRRSPRQSSSPIPMTSRPRMTKVLMLWQVILIPKQLWPSMTTSPLACPQVQLMWEAAASTMVKREKAKRVDGARKGRINKMECSILMIKPCTMMTWVTDTRVKEEVQLNYKTRYALFINL